MPKITKKDKDTYTITYDHNDWLSGLNQQYGTPLGGSLYNKIIGNSIASMRSVTPFRFLGFLSPSVNQASLDALGQTDSLVKKAVVRYFSGSAYQIGILAGGKLIKFNNNATFAATNFPKTIAHGAHTTFVGQDIVNYQANLGGVSTLMTFYSFYDATDWDVGVMSDTTATFDDDFMSTVPATPLADDWGGDADADYLTYGRGKPIPMEVGEDDILYMGSGRYVHAYDGNTGTNGTFSGAVLTLPPSYTITCFAKISGYLVIFAHNAGSSIDVFQAEAKAFFYNYVDSDPTYIFDLNDNYVSEAFEYQGSVGCFTSGRITDVSLQRKSKLRIFDGKQFEVKQEFNATLPIRGGVSVNDDEVLWNSAGQLHSWNNKYAPNKLFIIGEGSGSTSGLFNAMLGNYTISSGTTTSGGIELISGLSTYDDQANLTTVMTSPYNGARLNKLSRFRIYFADTCSGGRGLQATIQTSRGTRITDIKASIAPIRTITEADLIYDAALTCDGTPFPLFEAIGLVLQWEAGTAATDAPVIDRIELDFKPIQ
jgi:hypothetical protein